MEAAETAKPYKFVVSMYIIERFWLVRAVQRSNVLFVGASVTAACMADAAAIVKFNYLLHLGYADEL